MLIGFKSKVKTVSVKAVAVLSLMTGGLAFALPAYAEPTNTPPQLATVGAGESITDGDTVYTESDGVVRLTFSNAPYAFDGFVLTSWDKLEGTWSDPQTMVNAYRASMECFSNAVSGQEIIDAKPIADACYNEYGFPTYEGMSSTPLSGVDATVEYTPSSSGVKDFFVVSMWRTESTLSGLGYDFTASEPLFFSLDVVAGSEPAEEASPVSPDNNVDTNINSEPVEVTSSGFVEETAGFFSKTVFSALRTLGSPAGEFGLAAVTAGLVVVLSLLVGFPTQMLNSTLEANRDRFKMPKWFASLAVNVNMLFARISGSKPGTSRFKTFKAYIIIVISSIIAGFVQPDFGFNMMSLRLVLTLLLAFIIINIGSSYVIWLVGKRYGDAEKPQLKARPSYLIFVIVTVLFSRLVNAEPAIVFGALLAIELSTRVVEAKKIRTEMYALGYIMFVGVAGWIVFMITFGLNNDLSVILSEFGSVLAVEALSTLPILLLPMRFMFGVHIWKQFGWKRWLAVYASGLFLFSFVLLPMPFSWDIIDVPFVSWFAGLLLYGLFAVIVWWLFRNKQVSYSDSSSK